MTEKQFGSEPYRRCRHRRGKILSINIAGDHICIWDCLWKHQEDSKINTRHGRASLRIRHKTTHTAEQFFRTFRRRNLSGPSPTSLNLQILHQYISSYWLRRKSALAVVFMLQDTFKYKLARVLWTISKNDFAAAVRRWLQHWKKYIWV
jgi:REP element-mobilizing transposase RayT